MIITQQFLDDVGWRSPMARSAMGQAGDKIRLKALKKFLVSNGACEITFEDISRLGLVVMEKSFCFTPTRLVFVWLDEKTFSKFKPVTNTIVLDGALYRHGVIGLRRKNDA